MGETARDFPRELPSPIGERPGDAALTARRRRRYRQVLARRTGRLAVVVEDCYDPQNATAVVRTCDAFGIHRCHVVTGHNPFRINRRVSQGAHHYLDLRIHSTIEEVYAELRADGFRIAVADCAADVCRGPGELLPELDAGPLAVVFGNEGHGLGAAAREGADLAFALPMLGFAQSLNLSATAAITCFWIRVTISAMRRCSGVYFPLTGMERPKSEV